MVQHVRRSIVIDLDPRSVSQTPHRSVYPPPAAADGFWFPEPDGKFAGMAPENENR